MGPGDDAAVLADGTVLSTDLAIEGVHFRLDWITAEDLPARISNAAGGRAADVAVGDDLKAALRVYERNHIDNVLVRCGGDKRKAADQLGISLSSLYRKLEELAEPEA